MSAQSQRTCPSCGNEFSGGMEFCPVCILRRALPGASSFEEAVDTRERPLFQQVQEKALGQVLGVIRGIPAAASEHVEWIPIVAAQLPQRGLPPWRLALRRLHDDRPARGVKARRALRWRTLVAFHKYFRVFINFSGSNHV